MEEILRAEVECLRKEYKKLLEENESLKNKIKELEDENKKLDERLNTYIMFQKCE